MRGEALRWRHGCRVPPAGAGPSPLRGAALHPHLRPRPSRARFAAVALMLLSVASLQAPCHADARTVRVGIYQNAPKVFVDDRGTPRGIFVDVVDEIARREGWKIDYVYGTWAENIHRLERREIDLLVDVSYTKERAEQFSLSRVSVLESWCDIFSRRGTHVESLRDLNGRRIAVLEGSVQEKFLREEVRANFGIDFTLLPCPDYPRSIQALNSGAADLLVATRFFSFSPDRPEGIVPAHVIFRPDNVYFAFPKGADPDLIETVDRRVASMKNDPRSPYYRSLHRWLDLHPEAVIPAYVKAVLAVAASLLAVIGLFSFLLRRQVALKTRKLKESYGKLKEAHAALRNSENKYRTLFEWSADGIFLMTDTFTDCNEQACRLWKCRREDIVGHSPAEFSPRLQPDGQLSTAAAKDRIDRALAGDPQYFYWMHKAKDGTLMDAEVSLKALTVSRKTLLQATVRDITARKRAERKLREADRALAARSTCSRALVCATEESALLQEICRVIVEECGYRMAWVGFTEPAPGKAVRLVAQAGTAEDAIGALRVTWGDDEHGRGPTGTAIRIGAPSIARDLDSNPAFAPWREEAKRCGYVSSIGLPLLDGGVAFGALTINAVDPDCFHGEEMQLLSELAADLAYGITALRTRDARRRAQDELERYRDRLEHMVEERTAQLAESNRRLEIVNRELEAFSYSASHDLRAPLRSMEGFSQALLEDYGGALEEKARNYLGRIIAASRNMAGLIDDLLSLSRVTRSEMRIEEVDLSAMAKTILATHARMEPGRSVECVVEPAVTARCDPRLIRIALENILGNAWKFTGKMPKGRIEFGAVRENGKTVFRVRDNGAGFEMEYVAKLFNPFQRLHAAGDFPGTGIGLAIVQRIVHRHGGTVRAEGRPGEGATIYFTL